MSLSLSLSLSLFLLSLANPEVIIRCEAKFGRARAGGLSELGKCSLSSSSRLDVVSSAVKSCQSSFDNGLKVNRMSALPARLGMRMRSSSP